MAGSIARLLHGDDAIEKIGETGMAGALHIASVISFVQQYAKALSKKA